jgi:predicted transcriptional regulator
MTANQTASLEQAAAIIIAYLSNNQVAASELPALIGSVRAALEGPAAGGQSAAEPAPVELVPAVAVKKSITPDYLISLEDGKKFKSLKRYLATSHGMTPDDYRKKWGLADDYPMVAPNYAAARSALAKSMGLGRKRADEVEAAPEGVEVIETVEAAPKPKRGRAKKAAA